jgi:ankyrin repeat protein
MIPTSLERDNEAAAEWLSNEQNLKRGTLGIAGYVMQVSARNKKQYKKFSKKTVEELLQGIREEQEKSKLRKLLNLDPWKEDKVNEDSLLKLINDNPSFCGHKFSFDAFDGELLFPLHILCALGASKRCVKTCHKMFPKAAEYDNPAWGAPLHFACAFYAPVDVVSYLAKKHPDVLEKVNKKYKSTPLHLACEYQAKPETVDVLCSKCPQAAREVDRGGRTPLNCACSVDIPSAQVVEILTKVYPEAGSISGTDGKTPLLNAIDRGADINVLRDLIVSHPQSASVCDRDGSTPLHLAVASSSIGKPIIKGLIRAHNEALRAKDNKGRIPLHVAVERNPSLDLIKTLVKKYPRSLEIPNSQGELPYDIAKRLGRLSATVQFLKQDTKLSKLANFTKPRRICVV